MTEPTMVESATAMFVGVAVLAGSGALLRRLRRRLDAADPPTTGADGQVPWGVGSVFLCFVLWHVVAEVGGLTMRAGLAPSADPSPRAVMAATTGIYAAVLLLLPLALRASSGAGPADLGLRRGRIGRDARLGVAAALAITPMVYLVQVLAVQVWEPTAHPIQEMMIAEMSPTLMGLVVLTTVVFAPAAEEFLFRQVLQGWLAKRLRPEAAVVETPGTAGSTPNANGGRARFAPIGLTALIFAIFHYPQWPAPIPLVVLGLGLGYLAERTGGIVASFVLHALFNGLSTLMLAVMLLTGTLPEAPENHPEADPPASDGLPTTPEPIPPLVGPEVSGSDAVHGGPESGKGSRTTSEFLGPLLYGRHLMVIMNPLDRDEDLRLQ